MHPDYLDYVEKKRILPRAEWHDVKALCRKLSGCSPTEVFVTSAHRHGWDGWVVEFRTDVDLSDIKRQVYGTCILGKRAVFLGVYRG